MPSYSITHLITAIKEKGVRYVAVTVFNVLFGQSLLYLFSAVLGWAALMANFVAVTVSAIPAYMLSRAWVWGKTGKNRLMTEILPFWGMALAGLAFSSLAVKAVESKRQEFPLVVNLASLVSFGILWVIKFFILDSLMFGSHHHLPDSDGADPG